MQLIMKVANYPQLWIKFKLAPFNYILDIAGKKLINFLLSSALPIGWEKTILWSLVETLLIYWK